ncbi:MAG: hypothetical protein WBA57_11960 [Elainellaceae cyanobacterium]
MEKLSLFSPKRKNEKAMRSESMMHDEPKRSHSILLTDQASDTIDRLRETHGFPSRSELVEFLINIYPAIPEMVTYQAACETYGKGERGVS